jgi:hypothetical protein
VGDHLLAEEALAASWFSYYRSLKP